MKYDLNKLEEKRGGRGKGALSIYWRLFRTFAAVYWIRLALGIGSGLVMGGATSAWLRFMDLGLNVIEAGYVRHEKSPKSNLLQKVEHSKVLKWVVEKLDSKNKSAPQTVSAPPTGDETDTKPKQSGLMKKINEIGSRFGLEIDENAAISLPMLCLIIGVMFSFFLMKALGAIVNQYFLRWVSARTITDIRIKLFEHLQYQSVAFFADNDIGKLMSRCLNDLGVIEHTIANSAADLCTSPILILVSVQFIIQKALEVSLVKQSLWLLIAMPVCLLPIMWLSYFVRVYQRKVLKGISVLMQCMTENFSGIKVVKAFNTEQVEALKFLRESNKFFRSVKLAMIADVLMPPVMQTATLVLAAVFLIICFHYQVALATLIALGVAAQQIYKPIKDLAKLNSNLQKSAAACERVFELLDMDTSLKVSEPVATPQSFENSIVFKNVSFAYDENSPVVLKNLNLEIKKGQFIAIVGQTGSGKSTVANLLSRFYDPTSGSVTLDGKDLRNIDNSCLRKLVGLVSQETFLFNESLMDNIKYGSPDATDEQAREAARQASAESFILETPEQYQRLAGERGNLLSGGQKQRLAIARVLLKNPPILILDEATSALDTATEQQVQEALNQLMKDRTVVAIAHRLSTILEADKILVMDHGEIIESGSHQELLKLNGAYKHLYDLQYANSETASN